MAGVLVGMFLTNGMMSNTERFLLSFLRVGPHSISDTKAARKIEMMKIVFILAVISTGLISTVLAEVSHVFIPARNTTREFQWGTFPMTFGKPRFSGISQ